MEGMTSGTISVMSVEAPTVQMTMPAPGGGEEEGDAVEGDIIEPTPADAEEGVRKKFERKQVTLSDKKDALRLLGVRSDGTFGAPHLQPTTNKKWSNKAVADKYGVSKPTVTGWKNASRKIMRADIGHGRVGKKVRMRDSPFASLEAALHAELLDNGDRNGDDGVKAEAVKNRARSIRDDTVRRLKIQMKIVIDDKERATMRKEIEILEAFRTSTGWVQKFISRHKYFCLKEMEQAEEDEEERKEREESERGVREKMEKLKKYQESTVAYRTELCGVMGDRALISDSKAQTLLATVDIELERVAKLFERVEQRGSL